MPGVAYAEAEPAGPETTRSPRSPAKTPPEQRLASSGARRGEASPASPHPRPAVVRALPRTLQTKGMALMAHRRGPAGPDSEGGQPAGCRSLDPSAPGGGTGGGVGAPASAANNLKLPAKVLKKLGNLSSWQPAGGRHGSGSKSSQW